MNLSDEKILRGLLSIYLLREMCIKPRYGYELNREVTEKIGVELPKGTVYVLLKNLKNKGLIENEGSCEEDHQKTVIYRITDNGHEFVKSHYHSLRLARGMIDDILMTIDNNL